MKVLTIFGTRPEAIKMAPVVQQLRATPFIADRLCVTAQHRAMLDQVLELFDIVPDIDLDLMRPGQSLTDVTTDVLSALDKVLNTEKPDRIIVHGDTTTSMAATLAAFYHRIPVAHVEAGLRTNDLYRPWPEEMNRRVVDCIADLLFAPTDRARQALLNEGVSDKKISVTGNTVIDALLGAVKRFRENPQLSEQLAREFHFLDPNKCLILVTGHRRESFGDGFRCIVASLAKIAEREDVEIVYPVHLNRNVKQPVEQYLAGHNRIHLLDPIDYLPFCYLMERSHLILTDSGGIQEEAPTLGKPVLVMRDVTERPEAVDAGTAILVGTEVEKIVSWTNRLLDDHQQYKRMSKAHNPFGDGHASEHIVERIITEYGN